MAAAQPRKLDIHRERLNELKAQLELDLEQYQTQERELAGGPDEPGPGQHWEHAGYGDHLADDATELFEREKVLGLEQALRQHQAQVEHALARVADGGYGTCEVCGLPIPEERLQAMPEATVCVSCKAEAERRVPAA